MYLSARQKKGPQDIKDCRIKKIKVFMLHLYEIEFKQKCADRGTSHVKNFKALSRFTQI